MDLKSTEDLILDSFKKFIGQSPIDNVHLDMLSDEVVVMYVTTSIKQFYEEYENQKFWIDEKIEEAFDLENFVEIIDAYFDGFRDLEQKEIVSWLTKLKKDINYSLSIKTVNPMQDQEIIKSVEEISLNESNPKVNPSNKKQHFSNPDIENLSDMFPLINPRKISKIYKRLGNDYNRSIDELLMLAENDSSGGENEELLQRKQELNEEERRILKERTVEKYGLVKVIGKDERISPMNHPKPVWNSEKKLIRYYDSKVVTTKGEKTFINMTKEEIEQEKELKKKTSCNLKPARAYRFH